MKWGSPLGQGPQELLLWLLASVGSKLVFHVPISRAKAQTGFISEEAAPPQSHPGASPPPKTPINANKNPTGLGN